MTTRDALKLVEENFVSEGHMSLEAQLLYIIAEQNETITSHLMGMERDSIMNLKYNEQIIDLLKGKPNES